MSKKDARKISLIEELIAGRATNNQVASLLDLSKRQVQRLKAKAVSDGSVSLLHKNRGRKPANTINPSISAELVDIYRNELSEYNFSHATDVLSEEKGIFVSVSTVSRYLKANNFNSPKAKRRPKHHRSRNPRSREGELVQMDASSFDWLSSGSYLHLHGAIDDATGKILALYLDKEETHSAYCELMFKMNTDGHLPRELYTDARTVFVYDSKTKKHISIDDALAGKTEQIPQFARALKDINVRLIIAKSPQAKGSIERLWETLQDRLTKDLKRLGFSTVDAANLFLLTYVDYYNAKFAVPPLNPEPAYLNSIPQDEMHLIFARHDTRILDSGLSFSFQNTKYKLPSFYKNKEVPASPHDTLTVISSKHVGIQVLYNGLILKPELLLSRSRKCASHDASNPKITHRTTRGNSRSPWFTYTNRHFPSQHNNQHRDDIFPD